MGAVYLAVDPAQRPAIPIVIKLLKADLVGDEEFVLRFKHEGELATRFASPHLVRVFDVGQVEETFYIAMEYLAGWSLSKVIQERQRREAPLRLPWIRRIILDALSGLAVLHGARDPSGAPLGFIHRDIAPKNLMVGARLRTHLIDLGIGKSTAQDWKTRTGVVLGTPGYMSPEQALGRVLDQRSDVFAMSLVLFELATLRRYIERGPIAEMMRATVLAPFRAPSSLRPELPRALDEILALGLAKKPEDRFQSAAELARALEEAIPPTDREREELEAATRELEADLGSPRVPSAVPDATTIAAREGGGRARARFGDTAATEALASPPDDGPQDTWPLGQWAPTHLQATAIRPAPRRAGRYLALAGVLVLAAAGLTTALVEPDRRVVARVVSEEPAPRATVAPRISPGARTATAGLDDTRTASAALELERGEDARERLEPPVERLRTRAPRSTGDGSRGDGTRAPEPPAEPREAPVPERAGLPELERHLDVLLERARTLRRRHPDGSPSRERIDHLLAELLQLRASARLEDERARVAVLERELERHEAYPTR